MAERILVSGGAGFIGSHLIDLLLETGYDVTAYDNLEPQVHGDGAGRPAYLHPDCPLIVGDARDRDGWLPLLQTHDVVVHLAAMVGVGQSMYQPLRYTAANTLGTAALLDALVADRGAVRKLVVASSMSIYGEGRYQCAVCGPVAPPIRGDAQLAAREWELRCPRCGGPALPSPTDEDKPLETTSVYAYTKRHQEELSLCVGRTYGLPTVALRFFNTYGPRQALSNPYTGVAAIFSSRLLNGRPPVVYEDGRQSRDFTHVRDVARGILLSIQRSEADYQAINLGTGRPTTVLEVAETLTRLLGVEAVPEVVGQFRSGDIRHCYGDISRA
ncbi:MAG: NAD-dependent epimerase/dehydratase family protein, partial [Chloroflexi bacterium]|nr:NAD-dependent epimerase/dehydratase family protein [Chloroflexota bacterium]